MLHSYSNRIKVLDVCVCEEWMSVCGRICIICVGVGAKVNVYMCIGWCAHECKYMGVMCCKLFGVS